jgi:hypothetical protein
MEGGKLFDYLSHCQLLKDWGSMQHEWEGSAYKALVRNHKEDLDIDGRKCESGSKRNMMGRCRLDSSGLGYEPVSVSCELPYSQHPEQPFKAHWCQYVDPTVCFDIRQILNFAHRMYYAFRVLPRMTNYFHISPKLL